MVNILISIPKYYNWVFCNVIKETYVYICQYICRYIEFGMYLQHFKNDLTCGFSEIGALVRATLSKSLQTLGALVLKMDIDKVLRRTRRPCQMDQLSQELSVGGPSGSHSHIVAYPVLALEPPLACLISSVWVYNILFPLIPFCKQGVF